MAAMDPRQENRRIVATSERFSSRDPAVKTVTVTITVTVTVTVNVTVTVTVTVTVYCDI